MPNKEFVTGLIDIAVKERYNGDVEKLTNQQLLDVFAEVLSQVSERPDIDAIAKGLQRQAQARGRALGI